MLTQLSHISLVGYKVGRFLDHFHRGLFPTYCYFAGGGGSPNGVAQTSGLSFVAKVRLAFAFASSCLLEFLRPLLDSTMLFALVLRRNDSIVCVVDPRTVHQPFLSCSFARKSLVHVGFSGGVPPSVWTGEGSLLRPTCCQPFEDDALWKTCFVQPDKRVHENQSLILADDRLGTFAVSHLEHISVRRSLVGIRAIAIEAGGCQRADS